MKEMIRIAIDGPSGAGKSTIAKAVAGRLGIDYIDTGAMYRSVAYKVICQGIDPSDHAAVRKMLEDTQIDFTDGDIILDGEKVNDKIRTPEVAKMASQCSSIQDVRSKLVDLQRQMGSRKSVIMDGRDICTNVLKDAEYKFFLTASAEERADRRYKELKEKGTQTTYEQVLEDIRQRDHNDMTRKLNPLRKADDAEEIDTTGLSIDQVIDKLISEIR